MSTTRLRKPLPPLNPANFSSIENPKYQLKILQQPLFARESNNLKRLLHPCPVIYLTVSHTKPEVPKRIDKRDFFNLINNPYKKVKTEIISTSELVNITNHTLAGYFIRASAIEIPYGQRSSTNTNSLSPTPEELLIGNKLATGYSFHIPVSSKTSLNYPFQSDLKSELVTSSEDTNNVNNGIVFIFNDLGLVKRGNFQLHFELYKIEFFNYVTLKEKSSNFQVSKGKSVPFISKINSITSDKFTVYGSRQFYKLENQTMFNKLLKIESDQKLKNDKCLRYLRELKFIKELELDDSSVRVNSSSEESILSNSSSGDIAQERKTGKKIESSSTNEETASGSDDRMSIQRLLSF